MKVIPSVGADDAGEKGLLDNDIVIWQDGMQRDAIAQERSSGKDFIQMD